MTRINVGVSPCELPDKLLLAEHREITRIPNAVRSGKANLDNIPKKFTLGTGHVRFFYDKMTYLCTRYYVLYNECRRRDFDVTDKESAFWGITSSLWNNYTPTLEDRQLIIDRIESKGFKLLSLD